MCCSEESIEMMEVWYVLECEQEAHEEDTDEARREAA